ncbi:MAG: carboxypeptidase-like regulatory domain-containing protein, partial [Acidobacteriota bacterium]|nr:carboxypeptidase-like regulatory domain-containing protein [Acidobacteriota bacterium]
MNKCVILFAVLIHVLAPGAPLEAQSATGQITGAVRDATGGVMSKVKVTVTNTQTGLTRETTTDDAGTYVVPLLPAGVYLVTAEHANFKVAV